MTRALWLAGALVIGVAWVMRPSMQAQTPERYPHAFLTKHLGFTDKELRQAEQGRPVVKALDTGLDREIAIFGIIWIDAEADAFVASFRDIERFERGAGVLRIKKIGDPATLSDFDTMTLSDDDVKALPHCKTGDCLVKVDAEALKRFQTEVDRSAKDARAHANALAPECLPALNRYLLDYPDGKPDGAEEFFYWSKVNFGLRDTVRLNHVVIVRNPSAPTDVAIASKMLYASHYFHTALDLRYLARDTGRPDARGFYLMTLLRSWSDGMTGVLGGTIRRRAVKGSSEGLSGHLLATKQALEGQR